MEKLNVAVIYYSMSGSNYQMAKWAEEASKNLNVNVKLLRIKESAPQEIIDANPFWKKHVEETKNIPEAELNDLTWADAIIFSTPTRFGNISYQLKQFIDSTGGLWFEGKLVNKVVSAMTTTQQPHGGQEQTILQLYTSMYHWGSIIVAPGYTDPCIFESGGNPYGTSATITSEGVMLDSEKIKDAVYHQVKRMIEIAKKIK